MTTLAFIIPALAVLSIFLAFGVYAKVEYPSPLVFGCMIGKVCPVIYQQIVADIDKLGEVGKWIGGRLRRQARQSTLRVNWLYLCQQAANTILFLRALRFEELRIDPSKPGMKYDDREVLLCQLVEEAGQLRWRQVRCQLLVVLRIKLGLSINQELLKSLVSQYKELEEQFVHFAGMEENTHQAMLIERLGLTNWGLIEGGNIN